MACTHLPGTPVLSRPPSEDGFKVFDTPFGRVGIVICFDRHLPESIRTCALLGAALVIVPTANCKAEPMELFGWEIRVQTTRTLLRRNVQPRWAGGRDGLCR